MSFCTQQSCYQLMKNSFLNASQKVVRNGSLRVFVTALVKDEIRCRIRIHSNVPRDSTAVTRIKVLRIKQQLKPKLILTRFLPFIKLPKVSWKHTDSLHTFSLSRHTFSRQLGSFAKRRVWHKVSEQDYNRYCFKEYFYY